MNDRLRYCVVVAMALLLATVGWTEQEKAESTLRLTLHLTDGSRIIGVPNITSLPVRTSFAKMDIPLTHIVRFGMNEDGETASLELQNGDLLKAVIDLESVSLQTLFGKVSVGMQHVTRIRVLQGGMLDGLIAYYSFDEAGDKVTDKSGSKRHGTVHGAKWVREGKRGGAYDFSGSGTARIEFDWADMNGMKQFSASAWINSYGDPRHWEVVLSGTLPEPILSPTLLWLNKRGLGDNAGCGLYIKRDDTGVNESVIVTPKKTVPFFHEKGWRHIVLVWTGKKVLFYVDGELDSSKDSPKGVLVVGGKGIIGTGAGWGRLQHNFNGLIDEMMIFKSSLSESEVRQLYRSQKSP